jgi:hypothetical protein
MRAFLSASFILFVCGRPAAQNIGRIINRAAVEKIEKVLSGDDMQGRASFSSGIERAADYIETQFRLAGLKTLDNGASYRQPFLMIRSQLISLSAVFDGKALDSSSVVAFTSKPFLRIDEHSGYEKDIIRPGDHFISMVREYIQGHKNRLVLVDTSFSSSFERLNLLRDHQFGSDRDLVFVLAVTDPENYSIQVEQAVKESKLANVVGILPGRSRKSEYVIFSGHYDHLGIGQPDIHGDSIYNGANDDASGTTAVIMLARYFSKRQNNERTLVFAAFTAEEIGEYGSQYFSQQFDPATVVAMFNIEMIGTESKWGRNSAFITGYERTNMGEILKNNLKGSPFTFHPDPYPDQGLFYRSDNASLARQGVPAHTISTSKMDSEKYYHTQGDEIGTLDMSNMARIIRSIALSSRSIVRGLDKPSRVDVPELQ